MLTSEIEQGLQDLQTKADKIFFSIDYRSREIREIKQAIKQIEANLKEERDYIANFEKAKKVVQKLTDDRNEDAKKYITELVETGLNAIRQEKAYKLTIIDGERGNDTKTTTINLVSTETDTPRRVGSAVNQVTSMIFILSLIEMSGTSKMVAFDEYLGGASGETAKKLSDVLVALSKNNEFQIFLANQIKEISENEEVVKVYLKSSKDGLTLDKGKLSEKDLAILTNKKK